MEIFLKVVFGFAVICLLSYTVIGTDGNVDSIRHKAPSELEKRHLKILLYDGFEYGSWCNNGGKVFYHVANTETPSIQFRVAVTMWRDKLQFSYDK